MRCAVVVQREWFEGCETIVNGATSICDVVVFFFFSSRRRHTRCSRDWSSDVCSSDLFLLTGYSGLDPEVYSGTGLAVRGVDYLVYPHPRTITGGLRLLF